MKLLAAGFILSLLGSLPPGLISLTVAHTAIRRGMAAALALSVGAACAEFFQALAAVVLSDWFLSHPGVENAFSWIAMFVFFGISIFLLFFAKVPKITTEVAKVNLLKNFYKGLIISVFNLLAIPYWLIYCGWLKLEGWWTTGISSTLIFSLGVMLGTTFSLSLYAWLGTLIVQHATRIALQVNRLIAVIFLGLAIKLLIKLL